MEFVDKHLGDAECPISDHTAMPKAPASSSVALHQTFPSVDKDDLLEDIRLSWVDDPNPTYFTSHRALTRYARELKMITQVMKEYSKLDPKADQGLLDDTLQYGLKAHSTYSAALHQWLEDNHEAHSAPVVKRLVKEYEAKGCEDLKRYHVRASKVPDERSLATVSTTSRGTCSSTSGVSEKSLKIIKGQQQEIQQLQMQQKLRELALEEKDVEIKRSNIELEKKKLELNSYKQMVNELENITEADELVDCWPAREQANIVLMGGPRGSKPPGGIAMTDIHSTKQDMPRFGMVKIEEPRLVAPTPQNKPEQKKDFSEMGVLDAACNIDKSEQKQPLIWSLPRGLLEEKGICFTGKDASEYPAYRHRLLTNFKELRHTRPDILLRWIESTIDGQAKRYIRNAFAVKEPGEACDVIWDTLEEVYGRHDVILEHATKQVNRQSKSIGHDRQTLLEFRADLRNLKGVAHSVGLSSHLNKPRLLGQLYTAFSEKLRDRFDAKYPANAWTFDQFIQFMTEEISHIDSLHLMHVELKDKPFDKSGPKPKSFAPSRQRGSTNTIASIVGSKPRPEVQKEVTNKVKCWIHPEAASHTLVQCRSFLAMTVDERWRLAKDKQLCFVCFDTSHTTKTCKANEKCRKCEKLHHVLLHKPEVTQKPKSSSNTLGYIKEANCDESKVGLMLLTAVKRSDSATVNDRIKFYGAIDTGATRSLCSRELAEELQGNWIVDDSQTYQLFNGSHMQCESMSEELHLETSTGDVISLGTMIFVDQTLPFAEHLPNFGDLVPRVDMVIGGDLAWNYVLMDPNLARGQNGLVQHELGVFWLSPAKYKDDFLESLSTAYKQTAECIASCSRVRLAPKDRESDLQKLESDPLYCSADDNKVAMSASDEKVLNEYKESVKLVELNNGEKHLQFPLPWAHDPASMPNNYTQAKRALLSLQKRLMDQPGLRTQYCKKIENAISERHLIRIPDDELARDLQNTDKNQNYIPHFNTSQAKFRVVYDAAREYHGVSLNKLLNRGPILMQSLRSILIRFGERQFGIAGDITNMFFQIQIAPEDRDMIRILWFSEPDMKGEVVAYQFQVAPYGLRCIPSMAGYALMFTAESNTPDVSSDATSRVTQDMFVDDLISGVDSIDDGQRIIKEVSLLLKSTGFTMTKWNASHEGILADVNETDLAPAIRNLGKNGSDLEMGPRQATLGVIWDTKTDNMFVKKPALEPQSEGKFTKRQAVSLNHQFFDPMGWWSPFQVRLNLCCSKIVRLVDDWDAQVPPELIKEWNVALRDLNDVEKLPFARRRVPTDISENSKFEYHAFADSSKDVAAAAVYLRVQTGENYDVSLICAKTSIFSQAEMTRGSMPRKEIVALDLGARLLKECLDSTSLPIEKCELWSDSQTAIKWCTNKDLELRIFERNRVDLVLRNTRGKPPKYVPTHLNPADVATRPCRVAQEDRWKLWTRGPDFLCRSREEWKDKFGVEHVENVSPMVATIKSETKHKADATSFMGYTLERTNSLSKATQVLSSVIRCFKRWKNCALNKESETLEEKSSASPNSTRLMFVKIAQRECFGKILKEMETGMAYEDAIKRLPKSEREPWMFSIVKLVPFLDCDGILRVGGRAHYNADMLEEQKHPAFLPKSHKITNLFVTDCHEKLGHRAAETVLAALNQDFGLQLVGGIVTVRGYLAGCFVCKLLRKSRVQQLMAPLPQYRVRPRQPVFSSVSIDYAGPYQVKRGRSIEKRWLCIFVCNVTTCVRVEMVESLETSAFLNALRRFLCLTGNKTRLIRADCATTFIGAQNIMEKAQQTAKVRDSSFAENHLKTSITWEFSTPSSSHHQGIVERQIRTFKEVTEGVLGSDNKKRTPSDFELMTLFREAEYIMNCRPLGKYGPDEDDVQALRPIDLITGFMEPSDDSLPSDNTSIEDKFRRGHKYTLQLAEEWWDRWLRRYPGVLQERQKWTMPQRNLQKGDFVLLVDNTTPPIGRYLYAIVTNAKICEDGYVRSVTVRTSDGRIRERDVRKLVLLESASDNFDDATDSNHEQFPVANLIEDDQMVNTNRA